MRLLITQPSFGRFWAAGLFAQLAAWSLHAVMLIHVFNLTGSAFATGLIPVFSALPSILLGPLAGVLVDRWNRQQVMLWSALAQAVLMFGAMLLATGTGTPLLYAIIALQSAFMTFSTPAENALLPTLVPASDLAPANSLNALNDSLGRIVGPAAGAWLLVQAGFIAALLASGLLYLAGWAVLLGLRHLDHRPTPTHPTETVASPWRAMRSSFTEGIATVRGSAVLTLLVLIPALYMVADVPLSAVLPAFMQDSVGVSAAVFGTTMSVRGVTGLLGGLAVVWLSRRVSEIWLLLTGLGGYGISIFLYGWANSLAVAVVLLVPIGLATAAYQTGLLTLLQRASQPATRGRIFALVGTINGFITLVVSITAGSMGELVGTRAVVMASGALHLFPLLVAVVLYRRLKTSEPVATIAQEIA